MSTANLTNLTSATLKAKAGINTHFQYSGTVYQKANGDADPNAEAVVAALNVAVWRERISHGVAAQTQAVDALTGMKLWGHPGDVNSTETQIRTAITDYANDTGRRGRISAITGVNEPNNRTTGSGPVWTGAGTWQDQVVAQQYWIKDQVEIENGAGKWTGGKPLIIGPGIKHEHVPLDADLAALAAATTVQAGVTYHMADLCDAGDLHFYQGWNGPGFRMNGKDDNGATPPGVTLGSDGKISQEAFEIFRFRQIYDSELTGGSGALVSGHWKYTGGTVTTGHGATFPMWHSEGGTPIDAESGHTAAEWQAKAAVYVPEMVIRDFFLGVGAIPYQALTDRKTDGLRLGMYNLSQYPTGALPPYTALQTMCSYPGSTTFVGVGNWLDIGGHLPDCKGYAFSQSATEWWLYVLREADIVAHLQLTAAYQVEGVAISGDGTYHLDLSDSLTIWHVIPTGGGGGAPVWTDTTLGDRLVSAAYTDGVTATGATSYSILSGAFPSPMTFNTSTGAVGGTTPATAQNVTVVIRATNGSGHSDSPPISFDVTTVPVFTADSPPLTGTVGTAYTYTYAASGFRAPTFTLAGTAIPGLTMSADGTYSGTPTAAASYTNHAVAANSLAFPISGGNHTIVIAAGGGGSPAVPVFTIPPPNPPDGTKGVAYDFRFQADDPNGVEAPTFTVASGDIPPGMVLSAGGHLKSKPLVAGTYTFAISATNSAGTATTGDLTMTVVDTGVHGDGQTITYALSGPNSAFSFYPWFKATTMDPNDPKAVSARFCVVQDVNAAAIFVIRAKASGKLDIDDVNGVSLAKGDAFLAPFDPTDAGKWRCSCVVGFDGAKATLILRPYADLESTQASDILAASVASTVPPYQVELGNKTGEINMHLDTVEKWGLAQEIPPNEPAVPGSLSQLYSFTAAQSATSIAVNSRLIPENAATAVALAWSTSPSMSSPTFVGSQTSDSDAIVRHDVTGLTANTRYYFRLKDPAGGSQFGDVFSCKTFPAASGAWTRKVAVVSCMDNPSQGQTPQLAWQDVADWAPDAIWHLGDWGYWGQTISASDSYTKDLQKYDKAQAYMPAERAAVHSAGLEAVCISDHELHVNGDAWQKTDPDDTLGCPHSVRQMTAHTALFPIRDYMDNRATKKHRGYFYDIGSQVRVIVTDFRSVERNIASDTDGPGKQMWGAVQEAQIFAALDASKVNILVNETSWWWNTGSLRATDKPASYPDAQQRMVDKLNGTGAYAGGTAYSYAWVGGDRHRMSYLSEATAADARIITPQFISSGLLKNALSLQEGEKATWAGEVVPDNTVDKFTVCQWGQLTLHFDGANTLTATWNGRVGNTTRQVTDGVCTNGQVAITSATAAFTQSDKGMLIAGDGIRSTSGGNDAPTFISSVTDATHAVLTQAATSNQASATWTIQNNESTWQMSDFPGGSLTTETWTDTPGGLPGTPEWIEG